MARGHGSGCRLWARVQRDGKEKSARRRGLGVWYDGNHSRGARNFVASTGTYVPTLLGNVEWAPPTSHDADARCDGGTCRAC